MVLSPAVANSFSFLPAAASIAPARATRKAVDVVDVVDVVDAKGSVWLT